jgi:hypothetical protein
MNDTTIRIIVPDTLSVDFATKNLLPSLQEAVTRASLRSHEMEVELLSKSLMEVLESLGRVVDTISHSQGKIPRKITFSLGMDSNGSIGFLSTVAASVNHGASITVEFELDRPD